MSVFISGATGFIAQHIVAQLLENDFKVIGSVRSQEKADKLLKQFNNNENLTLEIVKDISLPNAFHEVFAKYKGKIKYVLHTSSPFFFDSDDYEKDLLIPALNGTENILNAILDHAADTVERVVITSSEAAMIDITRYFDPTFFYDENSWNPTSHEEALINGVHAYTASKKFAEKYAWDFIEEHKNQIKFALTTVNPCNVFGPQQFDENVTSPMNTSCEIINKLVHSSVDTKVDRTTMGKFIDVRDVAKAHLLALQNDNLIGERLLLISSGFDEQSILDIINDDFPALKGKIRVGNPGTGALQNWKGSIHDNSKTRKLLRFEFLPLKKSVDDTVSQILRHEEKL
ncbi:SDR family oxidoreductase NDAI_0D00910 [Naumovozyma dairenensis CBS 421]|uniref:NAD-dependent epimerase/dehydratase domain-containing protein n=1 Tax=Naumovozyma dairenensis (strain ATCC 10597 / BCRC 20456 / CBS 421 / NBRC 0211 / NRRL Y-12639) TaxID=1071378 RepID=G0W9E4_NAUDC|nr:hypothetical protein NDAI_0D00910 [Naumovozyma dairenensis CBS 421]CCD24405.1 hypothetical protein NDAI_0D00910 [Naumovozyma dairenensis CBS 421]